MIKVYFNYGLYNGCNYVRLWLPQKHNGFNGDWKEIGKTRSPHEAAQLMAESDVVVMHRLMTENQARVFSLVNKKKIVVDNDDTYKDPIGIKGRLRKFANQIDNNLSKFIKRADLVTVSTEFLKSEYEKINSNVVVLPNCVDPDDWQINKPLFKNKFRVGIIGSVAYDDFKICYDDLKRLGEEKDVEIVVLGDKKETASWKGIKCEYHPYVSFEKYPKVLNDLNLDIMAIPREDNYFNRCKSKLKFLEASMLEIPVLAQGFSDGNSPYQNPNDAQHMIIVYKNWYDAIMQAKQEREHLAKMAKGAKQYVLENYNIKTKAKLWKIQYLKLMI